MYLKAGLATRASRLLQSHPSELMASPEIVSRVTGALLKGEFYEQAGKTQWSFETCMPNFLLIGRKTT